MLSELKKGIKKPKKTVCKKGDIKQRDGKHKRNSRPKKYSNQNEIFTSIILKQYDRAEQN